MVDCYLTENKKNFIPIQPMMPDELPDWLDTQDARTQRWVKASGFVGLAGTCLLYSGIHWRLAAGFARCEWL